MMTLRQLVAKVREEILAWRGQGYPGASATSVALLRHWFETEQVWIVETKGREELDLPQKMARLKQWCADASAAEEDGRRYDFVFVDQPGFEKHTPNNFATLAASFTEYKR